MRRKLEEAARAVAISAAAGARQKLPIWLAKWGMCHKGRACHRAIWVSHRCREVQAGNSKVPAIGHPSAATPTAAPEDVEATVAEEDTEDTRSPANPRLPASCEVVPIWALNLHCLCS